MLCQEHQLPGWAIPAFVTLAQKPPAAPSFNVCENLGNIMSICSWPFAGPEK